jgi:hypothetical protein
MPNSIAMLQLDAPPNTVSARFGSTPRRPLREKERELLLRVAHTTQCRAHHGADAVAILGGEIDARVFERLASGDHGELAEAIEPFRALRLHVVRRHEVIHLCRVVAAKHRRIEPGQRSDRRAFGAHAVPHGRAP